MSIYSAFNLIRLKTSSLVEGAEPAKRVERSIWEMPQKIYRMKHGKRKVREGWGWREFTSRGPPRKGIEELEFSSVFFFNFFLSFPNFFLSFSCLPFSFQIAIFSSFSNPLPRSSSIVFIFSFSLFFSFCYFSLNRIKKTEEKMSK